VNSTLIAEKSLDTTLTKSDNKEVSTVLYSRKNQSDKMAVSLHPDQIKCLIPVFDDTSMSIDKWLNRVANSILLTLRFWGLRSFSGAKGLSTIFWSLLF
jgi:hypothetical protein